MRNLRNYGALIVFIVIVITIGVTLLFTSSELNIVVGENNAITRTN